MRHHVVDHRHRPEVITQNAWSQMRWERWVGIAAIQPPWSCYIIETSELGPRKVAQLVAQWLREHIRATKRMRRARRQHLRIRFGTQWRRVGDP